MRSSDALGGAERACVRNADDAGEPRTGRAGDAESGMTLVMIYVRARIAHPRIVRAAFEFWRPLDIQSDRCIAGENTSGPPRGHDRVKWEWRSMYSLLIMDN